MNEHVVREKPKLRWITNVAGIYLILLYIGLFATVLLVLDTRTVTKTISTPTPAMVSTPQILVHPPAKNAAVTHEDFSANRREWGLYYDDGKLEVIDGKLVLQSYGPNGIAIGINQRIAPLSDHYYIQADFSSDVENDSGYGLVFGFNQSLSTFYLFEVFPRSKQIGLFEYNAGNWTDLIPYMPAEMNTFPTPNTLSVYFDKGKVELYMNGKLATKYIDKEFFQSKDIGIYVNNPGFRLLVDDIFVYDDK